MIGYEVTIKCFIELDDNPGKTAEVAKLIQKIKRMDGKAIGELMIDGEVTIRLMKRNRKVPKPRNDAKRVIHADKE